ncbi:zinc finger protein ZFP2-like isoform X1 [Ornithodoros turicata]|uniref:zinc finger protein ZFP2-like isoform X1 n=2 Tax=Ornithodoros turicata TaxID=34597 RepID=UPI0031399433
MELSPKFSYQLTRVKSEPPDVPCLPGEGQIQQQHCNESTSEAFGGQTVGMCHIKEEPPDDCSDEHQLIEVQTEPYNTAILMERDHAGRSHDSTSEDATASTGMLCLEDEPKGICRRVSSRCSSSNGQFNINTATVQPPFDNPAPVTVNRRPTDPKPSDISPGHTETQEAGESSSPISDNQKDTTHKCNVCLAPCIDIGRFEVHLETNHATAFTCDRCSATIRNVSAVQVGAKRHMVEGLYKCKVCTLECVSQASLKRHMHVHDCNKSGQCLIASKDQVGETRLRCDLGPATLFQSNSGEKHMQEHSDEKPYTCDICPAKFSHKTSLQRHQKTHTGEKPHKCNLCPAVFNRSTSLQRHKRTHVDEKPCMCDICPATFRRRTKLQSHMKIHTGEKPHKCDLCPKEFTHSHLLKDHVRTHTGEKPYKCVLCPAEFRCSTYLRRHTLTHADEKPHTCDLCTAEFSCSAKLRRHKWTHTGEKPHKCDICPAAFRCSSKLRRHMQTHSGEKPFKCDLCPAEFIYVHVLNDHVRTHTGEKPYKCVLCPARFGHKTSLQRHKMTHTGTKPFKCDLCSAEFIQRAHLQRHKLTHMGEKPHKCDLCPAQYSCSKGLWRHKLTHTREGVNVWPLSSRVQAQHGPVASQMLHTPEIRVQSVNPVLLLGLVLET